MSGGTQMALYKALHKVRQNSVGESLDYSTNNQEFPYSYNPNSHTTSSEQQVSLDVINHLNQINQLLNSDSIQHNLRVGKLSATLAWHLGMSDHYVNSIYIAAQLHDIGKLCIAKSILDKPAKLSLKERKLMEEHCQIGEILLSGKDSELITMARRIALAHHERWNGSGYPFQLETTNIPLEARIVAVADVFDALLHDRPYKKAWPLKDVVALFLTKSNIHFDAMIVNALLDSLSNQVTSNQVTSNQVKTTIARHTTTHTNPLFVN